MLRSPLTLSVLLLAHAAWAEGAVLLFPPLGTPDRLTVSGRVFKTEAGTGSSALSQNLRSLLASNWEGADVEVRFSGLSAKTRSGHDGNFEVTLDAPKGKPFAPGLSQLEAHVTGARLGTAIADIVPADAPFFVISDFDDTLAVTQVLSKHKLLENSLLKNGDTQPVVEGMAPLMGCFREGKPVRPAFALVSGSPVQYTPRVQQFLLKHDFPPFALYLRDIGPGTLSDYKQPLIRQLLKALPQPVVLVGDSGEHDPEVYAQMRDEFPGRVLAVYIHDVGRDEQPGRFKDMVLFKQPVDAARDAVKRGLARQTCVDEAWPPPRATGKKTVENQAP